MLATKNYKLKKHAQRSTESFFHLRNFHLFKKSNDFLKDRVELQKKDPENNTKMVEDGFISQQVYFLGGKNGGFSKLDG